MNTRRINLRSLFWYMVRRFWVIIICAVCFGALLAGYSYLKAKAENSEVVLDDGSELTAQEKQEVENSASQYKYQKETEVYFAESPLMHLNPKSEPQVIVEYKILLDPSKRTEGDIESTDGTIENTYLQLLRAYINDGMYIIDMDKKGSTYTDLSFIKELVWCNNSGGGEFTLGVIPYEKYPDLVKDVREVTEAYMDDLQKMEPGLSIEAVKEGTHNFYDATTDTAQKNAVSNMVTYRKAVASAYKSFTEQQQAYFWNLVGEERPEDELEETGSGISLKLIAVGVILGFAGGIFILIIMLYLSPKHASPEDYAENFGLRSFGMMFLPGKAKWGMKKELEGKTFRTNEESVKYAALRVGTYCKAHDIKDIAVLCSIGTEKMEQAVAALKKALAKEEITLHPTEHVAKESAALAELLKVKKCIFIEELHGGNRIKQLELLKFCKENEIEVLGALGVAELTLSEGGKAAA